MRANRIYQILLLILTLNLYSCQEWIDGEPEFEVTEFRPLSNQQKLQDTVRLSMDMSRAAFDGIELPSCASEDFFDVSFRLTNTSGKTQKYYYALYYHNTSYAEPLTLMDKYNLESANNFYGRWGDGSGFHELPEFPSDEKGQLIHDKFKIVGNPRDEKVYYGPRILNGPVDPLVLDSLISKINNSPQWLGNLAKKAEERGITLETQVERNARWIIEEERRSDTVNNRWKRNPRAGNYEFMLVVAEANAYYKFPPCIKELNFKKVDINEYLNPFYYFSKPLPGVKVFHSSEVLAAKATYDIDKGLYIDNKRFHDNANSQYFNERCGVTQDLYENAHFGQFLHTMNERHTFRNIPEIEDVVGDNYSREKYNVNVKAYEGKEVDEITMKVSDIPAKTVGYDTTQQALFMKNPGCSDGFMAKENVGLITRVGFTYGKFTARIKFPQTVNDDYVWNGLTCAFWLLFQSKEEWNHRNECKGNGYIPKWVYKKPWNREKINNYSEIDIEIIKASKYWPESSYGQLPSEKNSEDALNNNLIIACTNWDMACNEPTEYNRGAQYVMHKERNKRYIAHRWNDWYKAITIKHEHPKTATVGNEIYYQIDWQPNKIIWRIGPSKDQLQEIAYMDQSMTKIPNNQMNVVFTQEFHDAKWWPTAPFDQNFIPFPKNDLIGYIYSLEVE